MMSLQSLCVLSPHRPFSTVAAVEQAKTFLADEWQLSPADRTWFTAVACSLIEQGWYSIQLGIYGCPDTWVLQVYDTGQCDPCYTFQSPSIQATDELQVLPDAIAAMLLAERAELAAISELVYESTP